MTALTHERLKELLHYDPDTGLFTWIAGRRCGAVAVVNHNMGYVSLRVDYKLHLAHRLAFLYMTGTLPAMDVDHINGVRSDNRWLNLREVSHTTNMQNMRSATAANTSGFMGVAPRRSKWCAYLKVGGKTKYLGIYSTAEEAHQAYLTAKRELHAGCTI